MELQSTCNKFKVIFLTLYSPENSQFSTDNPPTNTHIFNLNHFRLWTLIIFHFVHYFNSACSLSIWLLMVPRLFSCERQSVGGLCIAHYIFTAASIQEPHCLTFTDKRPLPPPPPPSTSPSHLLLYPLSTLGFILPNISNISMYPCCMFYFATCLFYNATSLFYFSTTSLF